MERDVLVDMWTTWMSMPFFSGFHFMLFHVFMFIFLA